MLKIAKTLSLPDEAVTQTFAILAKRGVGKTYTASVMAEEMLKNHLPVVVLDPIGVWWGLRSSADGKGAGLSIIVAGGEHGDIPLDPSNGEILARLVVEENLSIVIDMSLFRKGEQIRFVTDFAEILYKDNRTARHIIVDEADAFAPQRSMPATARMLGAMEDLVRRGRARGLGVTMITQRPAVLNKDVLTQIEVLVVLRMIGPQDRKAIDEWVNVHGTPEQRDALMESLPSLPIGTAWFWSPGWLDIFKRVEVRKRETLDSSSTPKTGKLKVEPRKMAEVNLDKLKKSMAATIEKAQADDPKILRHRILELETTLRKQKPVEPEQVTVEIPILNDADRQLIQHIVDFFDDDLRKKVDDIGKILYTIGAPPKLDKIRPTAKFSQQPKQLGHAETIPVSKAFDAMQRRRHDEEPDELKLRAGERKILAVLAQHYPMRFTRNQLGLLSGFSPRGGTFGTYFGTLKRHGLIQDAMGEIDISQAGLDYLGEDVPQPQTTEQVIDMWMKALRAGERKMLAELIDRYPHSMSRAELGERAGFAPVGGTFGTYLGSLRRNGLIEVDRLEVRASDNLFVTGALL